MSVEQAMECLLEETVVLGENLSPCYFVHHKIPHYLTRARTRVPAVGILRKAA
jgi:hypothetical protein